MSFLEFTFQSFWHFTGVLVLIGAVLHGLAVIVAALKGDLYE